MGRKRNFLSGKTEVGKMKNVVKSFLICCFVGILLIACNEVDGKNNLNDLEDLNAKEIDVQTEMLGAIYGVIDNSVIYKESTGYKIFYRYDWESGEKYEIDESVGGVRSLACLFDNKLYFWTTSGNRQREENVVDRFIEIDLDGNKISVLYEIIEKQVMLMQKMQPLENELLSVLKGNTGFEMIAYNAETKEIEVRLQYEYDFAREKGEMIRAIDTNEENVSVLVESRLENEEVQYRIDVYDYEYQWLKTIDITNIHGRYEWKETTDQFEYIDGYLFHSNGDGNDFFGKVSDKEIQTIYEYSYGYWDEYGDYHENPIYYDVQELAECNSDKLAWRMGSSELYRLNLKNGEVGCAEIVGQPDDFKLSYVLRIDEERLLIEFRKYLDEIGNCERKWYLVEIDELKFKKVSTK